MGDLDDLIAKYREGAIKTGTSNPGIANPAHDQVHGCFKLLRDSDTGRAAIEKLMADENPYVRLCAAAHSLTWATETARDVLLELVRARGAGSFDAEMTLEEFDAGRLTFDY
jgi:hypothetical protein